MTGLKQQFEMSEKTKRKKRKNFSKCCKSVKIITNNSEFQSSLSKMSKIVLMISILLQGSVCAASELQAPRFITQPSASGSIVAEGRTKILQCQALGKFYFSMNYVQ